MSKRWLQSRGIAVAWLLLVALVAALALKRGPVFDSSILSLLPESGQDRLLRHAGERISREFSERLLLVVSGADEASMRDAVAIMAAELSALAQVERVDWRVGDDDIARLRNELYPYRFVVLDDALREQLQQGEGEQLRARTLARLFGPLSGGNSLIEDPFGLFLENRLTLTGGLKLRVTDSLLELVDSPQPSYLLLVTLAGDPFSPTLQARVLQTIAAQRQRLAGAVDEIAMSGMLVHAAAGARQAQREISTIGLGSLLGIVILMLLVFRRLRPLLLLLFPVTVGCLFAASASLLIFHRVHLVTFAFGAGLVGVSIDYALHYLCERHQHAAPQVLPRILPGLLLGLFSSVAAYAAPALTPFPGLRQMALFSVLGLCASWLTVVLWLPLLTASGQWRPLPVAEHLQRLRNAFPRLDSNRWLVVSMTLLLVLAGLQVLKGEARDDIRLLQTSPPRLLEQERELQRRLGNSSGSRFLLLSASSLQACLQLEEELRPGLRELQRDGHIDGFRMLSTSLPSLLRQDENAALVSRLYQQQLQPLFERLQLSPQREQEAIAAFRQAASNRLTPQLWRQQAGSSAARSLLIAEEAGLAATAIRFNGQLSPDAVRRLTAMAENLAGVRFVDQVDSISTLLGKYRVQVAGWVLAAYLVVLLALLLRYRRATWRIVLPPFAASLLTLALLLQLQPGINLFHFMALILVLGIGLDMGIFMTETGESSHTWLAVSLSTCTSLLAFGLLALSNTPILHHFGLTVMLGLSLVWIMAPMMRRR